MKNREKGIKMAALFSLGCGKLALYPQKETELRDFLKNPTTKGEIKAVKILQELTTFFPCVSLIANYNNLDPFDINVIKAYFIGNKLVENVPLSESLKLAKDFCGGDNIILPKEFCLTHNGYVLCISPYVKKREFMYKFMDLCCISWGIVVKIQYSKYPSLAWVNYYSQRKEQGKSKTEKMIYDKDIVGEITLNQRVALHWKRVVVSLDDEMFDNLKHFSLVARNCAQKSNF